jgi:hypothetical protein
MRLKLTTPTSISAMNNMLMATGRWIAKRIIRYPAPN